MQGAHHIGSPGAERILVATPHQGLGGQVQRHLRLCLEHQSLERLQICQIADLVLPSLTSWPGLGQLTEKVLFLFGLQGVGPNLGTQLLQPEQEPAALKAGVAGEQDRFVTPKTSIQRTKYNQNKDKSAKTIN